MIVFAVPIHGDKSSYQIQPNCCRYRLVMSKIPREPLSTQDLVGGDNNRTSVIYHVSDIYRFVGEYQSHLQYATP